MLNSMALNNFFRILCQFALYFRSMQELSATLLDVDDLLI